LLSLILRCVGIIVIGLTFSAPAQNAWFADGFHGGIYGHYPPWVTQFMVDQLKAHPEWRLNLEIEPATWDFVRTNTPGAYRAFKRLAADQSPAGRVEFVNPAFGQSYLWNISGESIIQQFNHGMRKIREHFPNARFTTYASEEPCFTSALPGILKSFGFEAAVLKNPDTCWGGYTAAHGGELVNWIGPDGSSIPAVPRYAIESLTPGSTWQTIAAFDSPDYIHAAQRAGIAHPIGMCLQDAGWTNGPWLGDGPGLYRPSEYTTWRNYFANVAVKQSTDNWPLSQEDIRVNLMWGSQVLQRIAREVRAAENQIVMAEKFATLAHVWRQQSWPDSTLDRAWEPLLLSQHHDCWIVPYNGKPGNTWADKVSRWTQTTCDAADQVTQDSLHSFGSSPEANGPLAVRVFNSVSLDRTGVVTVPLPEGWQGKAVRICSESGQEIPSQLTGLEAADILFRASCPSLGYSTYRLEQIPMSRVSGARAAQQTNGIVRVETDFYRFEVDPAKGGTLRSLVARKLGDRELLDLKRGPRFNELNGFFFEQSQFRSNAESPATVEILENGPVRVQVRIRTQLATNVVTQWITVAQGEPRIDFRLKIDWAGNPGIGSGFEQGGDFHNDHDHKAFYEDRSKLSVWFPLELATPEVYKSAPFDVTRSRLTNTFFDSWSQIKNNVLQGWIDLYDRAQETGVMLLSDRTSSYSFGADQPLGLTVQYRGAGLWGRDYPLRGPTDLSYALLPHTGDWKTANLWLAASGWNEPLLAAVSRWNPAAHDGPHSLVSIDGGNWEVTSLRVQRKKVLIRFFNASADETPKSVRYNGPAAKIELVQLNGKTVRKLDWQKDGTGGVIFKLAMPHLGIATLQITP
jgi:alpha-mannosidase